MHIKISQETKLWSTMGMRKLVLFAASLAFSVIVIEIGLRLLGLFESPTPMPIPLRPDLYRADPELGYTLWPSTRILYHYPVTSPRELLLVSNSDGFRNAREFDEADSRLRIWVLGDSMVFGDGVAAADRFTEVIERLEPGWRVDNLGMTGWGLDLMVRAFERISRRVRPDVLVLGFYTDDFRRLNPFYSGQGYPFPKFELEGRQLVSGPFPTLPLWRRFRVVQAWERSYWRFTRNRFDLNGALLERLQRGLHERNGVLVVAFLPGRGDTAEDRSRRAWLRDWCGRARTPFVDLTEAIHGTGPEPAYIDRNPHWNERGHLLAGETIHQFLRAQVLSP